jgi:hypothetical protein
MQLFTYRSEIEDVTSPSNVTYEINLYQIAILPCF